MKNLVFVALFFLCALSLGAQTQYQDVIYLKNGGVTRGLIIEQVPGVSLKIETIDRSIFVYKMEEVEKITKEAVPPPLFAEGEKNKKNKAKDKTGNSLDETMKTSGYVCIPEINLGIDLENTLVVVGLNVVNGYQFNPNLSLGLGVGLDRYETLLLMPITADFRAFISPKAITPYFQLSTGYAFAVGGYARGGGFMGNPAFGVRFDISPKVALNFAAGYRLQQIFSGRYDGELHQINIKMGATF